MSQTQKLYNLLSDGNPHRTDEIMLVVYGANHLGLARVSARIHDLKMEGHNITGRKDKNNPTLYWYMLKIEDTLFNIPENKIVSDQDMLKYR